MGACIRPPRLVLETRLLFETQLVLEVLRYCCLRVVDNELTSITFMFRYLSTVCTQGSTQGCCVAVALL